MKFIPGQRVMLQGKNDCMHATVIESDIDNLVIKFDELTYPVNVEPEQIGQLQPLKEYASQFALQSSL